jgi:DNA-binding GntR family transcriptional regulator
LIAELVERATRQIEAVQARNGSYVKGGETQAAKAHAAILKAVASGQADRAEALMRKHLEWAGTAVMESLDGTARS